MILNHPFHITLILLITILGYLTLELGFLACLLWTQAGSKTRFHSPEKQYAGVEL